MKWSQRIALSYIRSKFWLLSAVSESYAAKQALELFCTPQSRAKIPLPAVFENAEKLHFEFEGNRVNGFQWNKEAEKKILILHGFESTALYFAHFISPLIEKGYSVLAFDAPAHGESAGNQINALQYQRLILELDKRYGNFDAYLAHSLGCLSLCLALRNISHSPETKVVLVAAAASSETAANNFFNIVGIKAPGIRKKFDDLIYEIASTRLSRLHIKYLLPEITASIFWIHDENDSVTPFADFASIREEKFPNIRFYITQGLGHSRIYRDPEVCKHIIEYLS